MIWALVPVKGFTAGKQRLASVLTAEERQHLCRAMLEDVLRCLHGHPLIQQVVLVSSDADVAEIAASQGILCWTEEDLAASGLNAVADAAARRIEQQGGEELMVVHGDLPLLSRESLSQLISRHREGRRSNVTIAPDRHGEGSNVVISSPPTAIEFRFGAHSLACHCESAQQRGVAVETFFCQDTGADIDTPEDLLELLSRKSESAGRASLNYLHDAGIALRLMGARDLTAVTARR